MQTGGLFFFPSLSSICKKGQAVEPTAESYHGEPGKAPKTPKYDGRNPFRDPIKAWEGFRFPQEPIPRKRETEDMEDDAPDGATTSATSTASASTSYTGKGEGLHSKMSGILKKTLKNMAYFCPF